MYKLDNFYKNCPQFGKNILKNQEVVFYETPCRLSLLLIHLLLSQLSQHFITLRFYPNMTTLCSGICYRKSICLSVVCNVHVPYLEGWTFRQYFLPLCT